MADFGPFASTGDVREPTGTEDTEGFPCGPADQRLFNYLFKRLESELKEVITFGGITESNGDFTQVRQAIEAMIAAATGSAPDTSGFLLMSQARTRQLIFPEVTSAANGKLGIISPGTGQVRVPAGGSIMHRGIFPLATALQDLATSASKVYHLRADLTGSAPVFSLKDLADTISYNPTALAETNSAFDSTYDNMLVARVVTNVSNVPTITDLVNQDRLWWQEQKTGAGSALSVNYNSEFTGTVTMNWARTPKIFVSDGSLITGGSLAYMEFANNITQRLSTRYSASATVSSNWREAYAAPSNLTAKIDFSLAA